MDERTVFIFENTIGRLVFRYDSPLWITDFDGLSSVEIELSESRSNRQVGSTIVGESVKSRPITLDGAIFEPLEENREKVLDIFAPDIPSTLTVIEKGESWYLDVYPEKTPEITPCSGVQHFQARLKAAYPYWRTTSSYEKQITGLVPMFMFPFFTGGDWYISMFTESYFSTIENKGNVPVEFTVVFRARSELDRPELFHVGTRQVIRLQRSMVAGDMIAVSTVYGQKGVLCRNASGEVENGFKYLSLDSDLSMVLVPGENILRTDAAINRPGLDVIIQAPEGVKSGV